MLTHLQQNVHNLNIEIGESDRNVSRDITPRDSFGKIIHPRDPGVT